MLILSLVAALALPAEPPAGKVRTDRAISLEVTLDAPPAEIVFDPAGDPEGASHGTRGARILRLVPDREIAFEWPMPPFGPELGGPPIHTWVELQLEPAPGRAGRTRLRFSMEGWKRGEKWDQAFTMFGERNWPLVLNRLIVYCRDKVSPDWTATKDQPGDALDRIIFKTAVVKAPLSDVWNAWTTTEGVKSFFAEDALVEAEPGGRFEIYFSKDAPPGSRGSEGCKVLSVDPMRSFAFEWNAPPSLPTVRRLRTNVQLLFDEVGSGQVRVRLVSLGWGSGEEWVRAHQYFDKAWSFVLANLEKRLAAAADAP